MRSTKALRLIMVTALLVTGVVFGAATSASATFYAMAPVNITNEAGPQNQADIDGTVAVWRDGRAGTCGAWDIWMYDFATGEYGPVTTADKKQENPRVENDTIVYQSDQDCVGWPNNTNIYTYDLESHETTVIAQRDADQEVPDVTDDTIVWAEYDYDIKADWDIWAYDRATGDETQLTSDSSTQYSPRISGDIVVWEDSRGDGNDVYGYDLSTDTEFPVSTASGVQWSPVVEGDTIAWLDERNGYDAVYTYDLATDTESEVCTTTGDMSNLEIGDGMLVWSDTATNDGDVYVYDLAAGTTMQVTDAADCDGQPAISNGMIVYNHYMDVVGEPDIWAISLNEVPVSYTPVEGVDRYETAIEVSHKSYPTGSDTVVLATGQNWPDALGSSALAGVYHAPILLTKTDILPSAVADEITRLGAVNVFIIGGASAISDDVMTEVEGLVSGEVVRLGGVDRYETAQVVASETIAANPDWDGTAFVTTGLNFPDALSASPLSAHSGYPIFLSGADGVSAETQAAMIDMGVSDLLVLGGTGVVPDTETLSVQSERLGGINRYGTAVAVATYGAETLGMAWNRLALTTGENFPDALSAGVAQGKTGDLILLTPPTYLDSTTAAGIAAHKGTIWDVWFIGGANAISADVRAEVQSMIP